MLILSDNIDSTVRHFNNNAESLSQYDSSIFPYEELLKRLFKRNFIEVYSCKRDYDWSYLLLSQYSNVSQFDVINKLISENFELPDKFICLAEEGDGFHGFRNRSWKAEKGNIHLSMYFEPQKTFKNFHVGLLIVVAVAVIKTIDSIPFLDGVAKTKWVNDIVINNEKVCGIITQSFSTGNEITGAVVGFGLNVLKKPKIQSDIFTPNSTSLLANSSSVNVQLPIILDNLLINLAECINQLNKGQYNSLLEVYIQRSAVIGKKVSIYSDSINGKEELIVSGEVIDINENLELILKNKSAPVKNGRLALLDE